MCFGPFHYSLKLGAERATLLQLMQKLVPRRSIGIFRNERTRSTPLDAKHMFWCILYSFGAFGTILFPYETRFKTSRTGAINARIRAMKSCWNLSQQTHPIHPTGPYTHILVHFVLVGCIWDRFIALRNSFQNGRTGAINTKVRAMKSCRNFSQRTHPMYPIGP